MKDGSKVLSGAGDGKVAGGSAASASPVSEASSAAVVESGRTVIATRPIDGGTLNVAASPGGQINLGFDPAAATATREGDSLVFDIAGAGKVVLQDFFVVGDESLPALRLPDGTIVASADFFADSGLDMSTAAGPGQPTAQAPDSGGTSYADGAGALIGGVDKYGKLGTDYWGRNTEVSEEAFGLSADGGGLSTGAGEGSFPGSGIDTSFENTTPPGSDATTPPATNPTLIALADKAVINEDDFGLSITGNVLSNDASSNNAAFTVTGLSGSRGDGSSSAEGLVLQGEYGSITLHPDGSYTYTLDPKAPDTAVLFSSNKQGNESEQEVFTYKITDANGLESEATLTIDIVPNKFLDGVDTSVAETIQGGRGNDVLVGDPGAMYDATTTVARDYNICFAIDSSGSMTDNYHDVLNSLIAGLERLGEQVENGSSIYVKLIFFGTWADSTLWVDFQPGTGAELVMNNAPGCQGWTNYMSALAQAEIGFSQLDRPNAENVLFLLSDGMPTSVTTSDNRMPQSLREPKYDPGLPSTYIASRDNPPESWYEATRAGFDQVRAMYGQSQYTVGYGVGENSRAEAYLTSLADPGCYADSVAEAFDAMFNNMFTHAGTYAEAAGVDLLLGGEGEDVLFGDVLNADYLLAAKDWTPPADLRAGMSLDIIKAYLAQTLHDGDSAKVSNDDLRHFVEQNHDKLGLDEDHADIGGKLRGEDDMLLGNEGNDILYGQRGDDILVGGNLHFDGKSGEESLATVLADGKGDVKAFLEANLDKLGPGDASDGDNLLIGGAGNDLLIGGGGNDTLAGGLGNDILFGGGGNDVFLWNAGSYDNGKDVIVDFSLGKDKLALADLVAGTDAQPSLDELLEAFKHGQISMNVDGENNKFTLTVTPESTPAVHQTIEVNLTDDSAANAMWQSVSSHTASAEEQAAFLQALLTSV